MMCHGELSIFNRDLFHWLYFAVLMSKCFHPKPMSENYASFGGARRSGGWMALGGLGAAPQVGARCSWCVGGSCWERRHGLTSHPGGSHAALMNAAVKDRLMLLWVRTWSYKFAVLDQDQRSLQRSNSYEDGPELTPLAWAIASRSFSVAVRGLRGVKVPRIERAD